MKLQTLTLWLCLLALVVSILAAEAESSEDDEEEIDEEEEEEIYTKKRTTTTTTTTTPRTTTTTTSRPKKTKGKRKPKPKRKTQRTPFVCDPLLKTSEALLKFDFWDCCNSFTKHTFMCPTDSPDGHICSRKKTPACCKSKCPVQSYSVADVKPLFIHEKPASSSSSVVGLKKYGLSNSRRRQQFYIPLYLYSKNPDFWK